MNQPDHDVERLHQSDDLHIFRLNVKMSNVGEYEQVVSDKG